MYLIVFISLIKYKIFHKLSVVRVWCCAAAPSSQDNQIILAQQSNISIRCWNSFLKGCCSPLTIYGITHRTCWLIKISCFKDGERLELIENEILMKTDGDWTTDGGWCMKNPRFIPHPSWIIHKSKHWHHALKNSFVRSY